MDNNSAVTLGDLIKQYRQEHRMSMQEFADRAGLSKSYINMLEKNENSTTRKPIIPTIKTINAVARAMGVSSTDLLARPTSVVITISDDEKKRIFGESYPDEALEQRKPWVKIPILGRVIAGAPMDAVEIFEGWDEIPPEMAATGEFFSLKIKGQSMEPKLSEGDRVIVRKQEDVDSGDIAIVAINGDDATVKKVVKSKDGITLIGFNVDVYPPHFYTNEEIKSLPITICGKVVESRHEW